jgi:hypothetical protein
MAFGLWQTILAVLLLGHGAGHMLFLVALVSAIDWDQFTDSWLLSRIGGCRFTQIAGSLIWLAATGAFLVAAFGAIVAQDYWRTAATIGALISILGIILFWKNPPSWLAVAASIVDLLILVGLALGWGAMLPM